MSSVPTHRLAQSINAWGYAYTGQGVRLEKIAFAVSEIPADSVVVKVAGCGLCHTDIGFLSGSVKTKMTPPLILGHEISGQVVETAAAFSALKGQNVLIPAVLPCGECELCQAGRDNICQKQKMPGNDFHGGFASHVVVPGRFLCSLPADLKGFKPAELSVIADAVTTPYQSLLRSRLRKGELAIVIGVGGIGIYMLQHAKKVGARVIAIDVAEEKLTTAKNMGAELTLNAKTLGEKEIREQLREFVKTERLPRYEWKIFETSGSAGGQNLAFSLMTYGSVLGIVGFTMDKLTIRLSNLMAFDADVFGNWGCRPAYYPEVVKEVLGGVIRIADHIETHPMDSINEVIALALEHKLQKRAVLIP